MTRHFAALLSAGAVSGLVAIMLCACPPAACGQLPYPPAQVVATAENSFSATYLPGNTIDFDCDNQWINAIDDPLPTWLQYEFPGTHTLSRIVVQHSDYDAFYTYLIEDYDVQISSDPDCGAGLGFVTVATNTGNNVLGGVQETTIDPPAPARCVRVDAASSYLTGIYQGQYNMANWVGLSSFQAVEEGTEDLVIAHPCADPPGPSICGNNLAESGEECDGTDAPACPGNCQPDCTCGPFCGDGVRNGAEECDGSDDSTCPGACGADCACEPVCGDNVIEPPEECDGTSDPACPGFCRIDCTCGGPCSDFVSPTATVAIHVSENTKAHWSSLGGPHAAWQAWHVYGFLMEQLRSDGTSFDVVSDAEIDAGSLMDGTSPKYAILFSLANDCISDAAAAQIDAFVSAGGHAFVGSTSWTRDETCTLRGGGAPEFALSTEMGLAAGGSILIGDIKRTGVDDPLVSHLYNDTVVRGWKLAGSAGADCYSHPTHWAQQVAASTATVLATTSANAPILAVTNHGAGRFIYNSEFNPLAGYSMHTIANFVYGFYRKAIDEAHAAAGFPNVRLGAWPWPHVAGFITRHDHLSTLGFDGVQGTADDALVAEIEAARGVKGGHVLYAGSDLPNSGQPCTDPSFGNTCDTAVQNNMSYMSSLGAEFGPHFVGASYLDRLQAFLGYRPTIYVASGACGVRDSHKQALVNLGIVTKGDVAFGAHPHFALKLDSASEYSDAARFPLVDIPATGYYGSSGGFAGNIWAHSITSNPATCNNDGPGPPRPCMEKAVDLQYELGGVINLYDHIGDLGLANPTPTQFDDYITYSQSLPGVYTTSALDIHDWWLRRDPARVSTSYVTSPAPRVTVDLSCADDPGPFSVEVDLPFSGPFTVMVDGLPTSNWAIDGNRMRVSASAPAQVEILTAEACTDNNDCSDGDACTGIETCDIPSGACLPGTPVICQPASPPCEGGEVCNPSTGACDPVADPALGTPCEADGNLCTNDHCDGAGSCVFLSNVSCQPANPPCEGGGLCNPTTGACGPEPDAPLSTPCETDGDLCTNDHCDGSGSCVLESTVSCDPAVPPCEGGQSCNPGTGSCIDEPDAPLSTPCDADGNPQTIDHCNGAGSCVPMPTSTIACQDGLDNDGDGLIDYPADPGCSGANSKKENPQCNDGIDNDGDTLIDYPADPNCVAAWSPNEAWVVFNPGCGLGVELTLVLPSLMWLWRKRRRRV